MSKPISELRIAIICNWNAKCGISTYSKYLVDAIRPKVKEVRVFSEIVPNTTAPDDETVDRCWKRGQCLLPLVEKIKAWNPDFIIIQHEYGIFPNAFYFMQMMQSLEDFPYVVTLHSVYEHLDKIVYSSCIRDMVVHSENGKKVLLAHGNTNNIHVIPHGCVRYENVEELWNIFLNPYTVIQFGFGFAYKGVDRALEAVKILKDDPKFKDIFYVYLCSENDFTSRIHLEYYQALMKKVDELGLRENVVIIRKYQSEETLNLFLRLAKLAIFPYLNMPNNTVYAASGAIRIAMANQIPIIASDAHIFDDLEGILPRPADAQALAREIDEIFSNGEYRKGIQTRIKDFIGGNTWEISADRYLELYPIICNQLSGC